MSWNHFWTILWAVSYACVFLAIVEILLRRRDPRGMMAWILALLFIPIGGLILYLLIGYPPLVKKVHRREKRRQMIASALSMRAQATVASHGAAESVALDPRQWELMLLASRVSDTTPTTGNRVDVYHDSEKMFAMLFEMIGEAESHVHLEYYIYVADETGRAMSELLARKVQDGVEVRLLLDAVGCWKLPRSFVREMKSRGIRVEFFLPWMFTTRRLHVNCRNHRKLVVVDGKKGVLGSHNIADEYRGRKAKYGPWRDTTLGVTGPAAAQIQEVFVEDWHFATKENLSDEKYFPPLMTEGAQIMQIVASGPDRREGILDHLLFAAVADAKQSILLITPYFVPDAAILLALQGAALRGVKVRLLLPSRSDHWFVLWAGRSTYEDLLGEGIEIYEYEKGMLHSKVVVVDQRWAMVGSANMDVRSFRINFELTSILYDVQTARFMQGDFEALLAASHRVTEDEIKSWNLGQQLATGLARLASPLL